MGKNSAYKLVLVNIIGGAMVFMQGCASPDINNAKRAIKQGDMVQAEEELRYLAEFGIEEANMLLNDIYLNSPILEPEKLQAIEATYLDLISKNNDLAKIKLARLYANKKFGSIYQPEMAINLLNSVELESKYYEKAQIELVKVGLRNSDKVDLTKIENVLLNMGATNNGTMEPETVHYLLGELYSTYLDMGLYDRDYLNLSIVNYQQSLEQNPTAYLRLLYLIKNNPEKSQSEVIIKQVIAAQSNLPDDIRYRIASVISQLEKSEYIDKAELIYREISSYYPLAYIGLVKLSFEDKDRFEADEIKVWIRRAKNSQLEDVKIYEARLLLSGDVLGYDVNKAEELLLSIAETNKYANYYLGLLYIRGIKGNVELNKGYQYLLKAARMGMLNADYELAQMLYKGIGFKPNYERAWVFANLYLVNLESRNYIDKNDVAFHRGRVLLTDIETQASIPNTETRSLFKFELKQRNIDVASLNGVKKQVQEADFAGKGNY